LRDNRSKYASVIMLNRSKQFEVRVIDTGHNVP
jgi:hypothetical protein